MAKKEKKEKKQKKQKKEKSEKRRKGSPEDAPNIPYPGSDKTKTFLAKLTIVLCAVIIGLMIYTVHYLRFISAKAQDAAAAVAAAERAAAPPAGDTWFLQADGTYTRADGTPILSQEPDGQEQTEEQPSAEAPVQEPGEPGTGEPQPGEPEAPGQEPEEPAQSEQNI